MLDLMLQLEGLAGLTETPERGSRSVSGESAALFERELAEATVAGGSGEQTQAQPRELEGRTETPRTEDPSRIDGEEPLHGEGEAASAEAVPLVVITGAPEGDGQIEQPSDESAEPVLTEVAAGDGEAPAELPSPGNPAIEIPLGTVAPGAVSVPGPTTVFPDPDPIRVDPLQREGGDTAPPARNGADVSVRAHVASRGERLGVSSEAPSIPDGVEPAIPGRTVMRIVPEGSRSEALPSTGANAEASGARGSSETEGTGSGSTEVRDAARGGARAGSRTPATTTDPVDPHTRLDRATEQLSPRPADGAARAPVDPGNRDGGSRTGAPTAESRSGAAGTQPAQQSARLAAEPPSAERTESSRGAATPESAPARAAAGARPVGGDAAIEQPAVEPARTPGPRLAERPRGDAAPDPRQPAARETDGRETNVRATDGRETNVRETNVRETALREDVRTGAGPRTAAQPETRSRAAAAEPAPREAAADTRVDVRNAAVVREVPTERVEPRTPAPRAAVAIAESTGAERALESGGPVARPENSTVREAGTPRPGVELEDAVARPSARPEGAAVRIAHEIPENDTRRAAAEVNRPAPTLDTRESGAASVEIPAADLAVRIARRSYEAAQAPRVENATRAEGERTVADVSGSAGSGAEDTAGAERDAGGGAKPDAAAISGRTRGASPESTSASAGDGRAASAQARVDAPSSSIAGTGQAAAQIPPEVSEAGTVERVQPRGLADAIVARARSVPRNGALEVRFALEPEHLGPVRVRIESRGDQLKIRIVVASSTAADALGSGLQRLSAQLSEGGLREPDIELGFDESLNADERGRDDASRSGRSHDDRPRRDAGPDVAAPVAAAGAPRASDWRLDLRA